VVGAATLSAGAANNITLTHASNDFSTIGITAANNVALTDANALNLAASTVSGSLNVTTNGALTQSGPLTVSGVTTLAAGPSNDITLTNAANDFNTVAVNAGNNVSVTDANDVALGSLTISGALSIAANGAITDGNGSANNVTAGSATLTGSSIGTLADPIETSVSTLDAASTAGGLFINQTGPVVLNNMVANGGNVVLSSTGTMTVNTVTATAGAVNLTAGAGSILDGNGSANNITASADSTLQASGVIGVTGDPLEVNVNTGNLGVAAASRVGPVSVIIDGTVSPSNTLVVLNVPPGQVIFNGQLIFPLPGQFGNVGQFVRNSNQSHGEQLGNARQDATVVLANPAVAIRIQPEQEPADVAAELTAGTLEPNPEDGASPADGGEAPIVAASSFPSLSVSPAAAPAEETPAGEERITDNGMGAGDGAQVQLGAYGQPHPETSQLNEVRMQQSPTAASGLEDVFFENESWQLNPESVEVVQRVASWLKANPSITVLIEGHADERETTTYNYVISERRAEAVQTLLSDLGIDRARLKTASYGKERPFCQEGGEDCRQQNRRGHLVLMHGKPSVQVYHLLPAAK
jgi:outer membrane protein OmpA-like peptidoglycan-associated protein